LRGALRLSAHASLGSLPGAALGPELGGALLWGALRVDLALRGVVPLTGARFGGSTALGGDLGLIALLARASARLALGNLELWAGGGAEVGAALGRGVGISEPRDASAPWVALEAAAAIAWVPAAAVALALEVEVLVPVVRPVLTVAGLGTLFRPDPVAGALRLCLELRFP
jgi:hypothetical protein